MNHAMFLKCHSCANRNESHMQVSIYVTLCLFKAICYNYVDKHDCKQSVVKHPSVRRSRDTNWVYLQTATRVTWQNIAHRYDCCRELLWRHDTLREETRNSLPSRKDVCMSVNDIFIAYCALVLVCSWPPVCGSDLTIFLIWHEHVCLALETGRRYLIADSKIHRGQFTVIIIV